MRFAVMGGSLRKESLNLRLLGHLVRALAALGHEVTALSGPDLRLPLYEGDLETPAEVTALASRLAGIQGLVIVSPEYNAGIPPHLKNAVDWLSTLAGNPLKGVPVLLAAASPGAFGGARGLLSWRPVLANLGALALPSAITVPLADQHLASDGTPLEARAQTEIKRALDAFVAMAAKLA